MKPRMGIIAIAFALVAGGVYADEILTRTWTDATGDHRWDNKGNWDPQIDGNHNNIFPAGRDWEVSISTAPYYHSLQFPEGSGTVTFKGAGQLRADDSASIQVGAGREMNVDGIVFRLCKNSCSENAFINGTLRLSSRSITTYGSNSDFHVIGGDAKVIVEGGDFGASNSYLCLSNNATLTVLGGQVRANRYTFCSPDAPRESITRLRLLGGTFWNDSDYTYTMVVRNGAHLEVLGGRLLWGRSNLRQYNCLNSEVDTYAVGHYFADCLPQFGAEVVIPSCTTNLNGAMKFHYSDRDYDFGGTIYATNNCNDAGVLDAAAGSIYFEGNEGGTLSIHGGATIYANTFKVNSNMTFTNNLDLTRLNLGIGGICRYQNNAGSYFQYLNFLDGIEFGAWGGDVARSGAYTSRLLVRPQGPVVFDTQDCFDPATSRTINMDCIRLDDVTDFKATGGGTVALYPGEKWTGEFRTLEVSDNTTLAFCTNVLSGVKAMNLKLGANATVKINMANGDYVDASSTVEFGEGAKIVVSGLPATLDEGMFYPVYFAPAGTDPDLSKIEYAEGEWPTGWFLGKTGNAVYLTDGNPPVYSITRPSANPRYWSGAGADNIYTNADNWVDNAYNTVGGADIRFCGRKNTDIFIDISIVQRNLLFYEDSGPFMFSGKTIQFHFPYNDGKGGASDTPTIMNEGKFPVVVSTNVGMRPDSVSLWLTARHQGSISLMGAGCKRSSGSDYLPMRIAGDIRIGGAMTSDCVRVVNNTYSYKSDRMPRLTVMPGGSLKTLSQSGDFNEKGAGAFAVATGGTIDIAGTEWLLASNNTHYVDGSFTVTCPLVPQGRQTFRGDGTLTLAGGVSSAPGGVRVEGNLTLVPANWLNDVALSVKDNVTIAPTGDWTLGGEATLDLAHHSKLTLATGGHKITLAKPVVSKSGTLAVTGGGTLALAEGTELFKVTCADGAKLAVAANSDADGHVVELLAVREDDDSIAFDAGYKVEKRIDEETGYTVYSVRRKLGSMFILR